LETVASRQMNFIMNFSFQLSYIVIHLGNAGCTLGNHRDIFRCYTLLLSCFQDTTLV